MSKGMTYLGYMVMNRGHVGASINLPDRAGAGTPAAGRLDRPLNLVDDAVRIRMRAGHIERKVLNARVRKALEKTVAKIEKHQQSDGSWNIAGGWAPVLGTSLASRSLFEAQKKALGLER